MLKKTFMAIAIAITVVTMFFAVVNVIGAASAPGVALTGQLSSAEEGQIGRASCRERVCQYV